MWKNGLMQVVLLALPWPIRRRLLQALFGYEIDATARIGLSVVMPDRRLCMRAESSIGHLTLARGMDEIIMGPHTRIGNLNWIYGIPRLAPGLLHETGRRPELVMDNQAVITHRHLIDCSESIHLKPGAVIAGYRSQLITHGLSTQKTLAMYTKPIVVGRYSMVGTGCVIIGGARLPDYSALGAGSTLRSSFDETHGLYSGVPAVRVASLPRESGFFVREGL